MQEITRAYEIDDMQTLDGERAVVARINTASVDRLRTVIDPLGCDVTHFNKTRSVLWQHGLDPIRGTVPIGVGWAKVRKAERDMVGKTTFASDDFSEALFQACREKTIRGWSIKAGVHEASPPTKEEIRSRADLADCEMIYRKWDLIELSLTPTPGNSDCLTMLVSRGLITAPEGFVPTEPAKPPEPAPEAHTEPYIKEDGGAWHVYHPDGQRALSFTDPLLADECLRLMQAEPVRERRKFYEDQAAQMMGEMRRMFAEMATDTKEYIDLYRYGKV